MNIFGASGHAKVIIEIVNSGGRKKIDYVFDKNPQIREILGYKVIHENFEAFTKIKPTVIAIGDNKIRQKIAAEIDGEINPFLAHKSAIISPTAEIGNGTVIMANAVINAEAKVGEHCIFNTAAVVEHDVEIGNFAHISPNAAIAGGVFIGEGTHIGIGASVIPGVKIGKWAIIGAGAVIIKDVPDFAVVVGNPGRVIKMIKSYGR